MLMDVIDVGECAETAICKSLDQGQTPNQIQRYVHVVEKLMCITMTHLNVKWQ
jgi:hypothetical protein